MVVMFMAVATRAAMVAAIVTYDSAMCATTPSTPSLAVVSTLSAMPLHSHPLMAILAVCRHG